MQWLRYPNKSYVNNLNTVRYEASRHFRNKKNKYLKGESDELETTSKNKNIEDLYRVSMTLRRLTYLLTYLLHGAGSFLSS